MQIYEKLDKNQLLGELQNVKPIQINNINYRMLSALVDKFNDEDNVGFRTSTKACLMKLYNLFTMTLKVSTSYNSAQ